MANNRTAKNTLYDWYGWLISHIFKTVKNSISNVKEKIVNTFPKDNRQKVAGDFNDEYIEYKSGGNEKILIEQYFENIEPHVHDIIDDLKTYGGCNIHLRMKINFILSRGSAKKC